MRVIGSSGRLGAPVGLDLPLDEDEADMLMALVPQCGVVREESLMVVVEMDEVVVLIANYLIGRGRAGWVSVEPRQQSELCAHDVHSPYHFVLLPHAFGLLAVIILTVQLSLAYFTSERTMRDRAYLSALNLSFSKPSRETIKSQSLRICSPRHAEVLLTFGYPQLSSHV